MKWTAEQEVAAVEQQLPPEKIAMRQAGASLAQCVEFLRAERDDYQRQLAAGEARAAALQRQVDAYSEALVAVLTETPLPNGEYVHLVWCSGSRQQPAGTFGVTCCCKAGNKRALAAEAAIVSLQAELEDCETDKHVAVREAIGMHDRLSDLQAQLQAITQEMRQLMKDARLTGVLNMLEIDQVADRIEALSK